MQLGLIGLGKMGANMRTRIERGGHKVVGYDPRPEVSDVASMADMVSALDAPRAVWIMVPSGEPTQQCVAQLAGLLEPCLLYTSPSPRDLSTSRMPSSA